MQEEPKEFAPLMSSIERVLSAMDTGAESQALATAVQQLRDNFNDYLECCCRKAHVIPYDGPAGE
jgi:hypothetical protein